MTLEDKIRRAILRGTAMASTVSLIGCAGQPPTKPDVESNAEQTTETNEARQTETALTQVDDPDTGAADATAGPATPQDECAARLAAHEPIPPGMKIYGYCRNSPDPSCSDLANYKPDAGHVACGPVRMDDGRCCVIVEATYEEVEESRENIECDYDEQRRGDECVPVRHYRGRPFVVGESARLGEVIETDRWAQPVAFDVSELDAGQRAALAESWGRAGAEEHASIASFSRFLLDLMQLGAPSDLIVGTTRAIDDEVRHAKMCFAIASVFAGRTLGPSAVDTTLPEHRDEEAILRDAITEGCIGETIAAAGATWLVPHAANEVISDAITTIANDEGFHAALAWQFVAWLLAERPHLVPVAADAFGLSAAPPSGEELPDSDSSDEVRFGLIPDGMEAALSAQVMSEVIWPAARELVG